MKEYTLDFLTTTAIKYGTRIFWTAVIVFVGLRVIRMVRTAAGQIMDRAGVEITLKKFLDMLLHAVLFGVMVFMAADQLGIKTTSFVAGYRYRNAGIQPCDAEYTLKFRRRNADPALKTV